MTQLNSAKPDEWNSLLENCNSYHYCSQRAN